MSDSYKDLIQESCILPGLKFAFVGEGAAGDFTVTGVATRDKLLKVLMVKLALGEAAPPTIAFTFADLTSEFTISAANTINNGGGTTLADAFALVVYLAIPEALG